MEEIEIRKSYRDKIVDDYEAKLKEAREWTRIIGSLYVVSKFLAFCTLTWATVALLGAFLPDILPRDFAFITCLLSIEAGRLASASSFLHFLMRPLFHGSHDPENIHHDEDSILYPVSRLVRFSSSFVQCLLIVPGFVVPIIGHVLLIHGPHTRNLRSSLRIFYSFVALNSLVTLINLICSSLAFRALNKPPEQSVLRYFDTVLENATSSGLLQADVFDFFNFAYTMLGSEYRRNVQPEVVAKNHKKLIQYLYAHRVGPDALQIYLEVEDPYVQIAAVNMVGFWSDVTWGEGVPEEERELPEELLTKLADKVGTGRLGWAATTSFGALAGTPKGARMVAGTCTSCGNLGLPDRLANLVDDSSTRSLALVRALVEFYEQWCVSEAEAASISPLEDQKELVRKLEKLGAKEANMHLVGSPFEDQSKLARKLEKLAKEAKLHRLRVYAAYLLLLLERKCNRAVVSEIKPEKDAYWLTTELRMLELLRSHIPDPPPLHLPEFSKPDPRNPHLVPEFSKPDPRNPHLPPKAFLRPGRNIAPPSWANDPAAGLVIIIEN